MEVAIGVSAFTGVLKALLPKLTEMLTDKYKLHKGAKEGIRYIRDELESMEAALEKVSAVPPDQLDKQVKLWARKVRDMSYNIQDTIDSFVVRVYATGECGSSTACCLSTKSMLPRTCKARGNIAAEIERIRKEVEEVSKRRERYKVDSIVAPAPSYDPRLLALYEDEAKLVGIDDSREEIIKLLSMEGEEGTSEQKLKLVSIVGPGGMGKTTLANAVYQKLKEKFDCTAFVSVSLEPNVKNILSSVLRQITSKIKDDPEDKSQKHNRNTETWSEKEVIDKIRCVVEKRRYLIVIDDIWDEQPWKLIECVLFENKLGSRVIRTTRNIGVARSCCSSNNIDGIVYELQPLSHGDSEQLFYHKIFGKDECPAELEGVSQRILEKCEGWPLGIITIASLLANKLTQTKDHWCSVYNSISNGLENNRGVKDMRLILSLSYRDMPSQLRPCLLYLSIFPEDHIIARDDLIQRWIAEDLVRGRQGDSHSLYELGDKYFSELINRSIIQPSNVDALGRAHACKVHDLVLEFITFLSAEEGFITILNGQKHFPSEPDSIHRLSLRNSKGKDGIRPQVIKKLPHVRTLVVASSAIGSMSSLSIFPALRVLELEHCSSDNIRGVESLVHLRYLRLSQKYHYYYYDNVCIKLPKGIGRLKFLQILDLKEAWIKELPSTVVQFRQLRVLEISLRQWDKRCEKRLLQCLSNVKQLEALCIFAPDSSLDFMLQADWAPRHLQRFTASASPYVRTEDIIRTGNVWAERSPFSTLPRWINSSLSTLTDLSIMVRTLEQADLDILADFLILRSVDLQVVKATRRRLEIKSSTTDHGTAFRCLGILKFASRAMGLLFRPGAMQKLQKLYLCFDVAETKDIHGDFDLGLENLTSLKTVNVDVDCRCARHWELKAAKAALRNATNLPNRPALDLKLHFQEELLRDHPEEEILPEAQENKKQDALLSRIGPFGGISGRARDIQAPPHRLESVTIFSGKVIESLAFSYTDHNGQQRNAGPWGSHGGSSLAFSDTGHNGQQRSAGPSGSYGGSSNSTIPLGPSEHLIQVSGTIGSFSFVDEIGPVSGPHGIITSLTFVTNAASYGPFGQGGGDPFVVPEQGNSRIVGFFGRAGWYLDAIGFYVRPL